MHLAGSGRAEEEPVRVGHRLDLGPREALGGQDPVDLQRRRDQAAQAYSGVVGDGQQRRERVAERHGARVRRVEREDPVITGDDDGRRDLDALVERDQAAVHFVQHGGGHGDLVDAVRLNHLVHPYCHRGYSDNRNGGVPDATRPGGGPPVSATDGGHDRRGVGGSGGCGGWHGTASMADNS
jgi:hypothetical protein